MPRKMLSRLLSHDATGGILLLLSTLLAIYLANSSLSNTYHHFLQEHIMIGFGANVMSRSLEFWVNDFLMAIFYYLIGSEIKREVMQGELSSMRHASLPVFAALGGMIFPALIFTAFNFGGNHMSGWGIPMATDIAFSLGILSLLGKRVPLSMKVFLVSLAVVDDLGAVIVIAVFYTADIAASHLFISLGIFALMVLINYRKVYVIWVYLVLGLFLWYHFLQSGVHPTIAGVLLAIVVPAKRQLRSTRSFTQQVKELSTRLKVLRKANHGKMLLSDEERKMVDGIISASKKYSSPLQNAERILQPWVVAFIMPFFAFTNAGIVLDGTTTTDIKEVLSDPIALGIMLGLLFGKQTGIMLFTWMAFKFGWGQLSPDMTWKHLYGISLLAGIGFTMSIFISGLAYSDPDILNTAKVGIIAGSLVSGITGTILIRLAIK
jgi:Na+:H+ antiporter, NhaA family